MSYRGSPLHRHQKFQHSRFVERDCGNDEIDLLLFKNSIRIGGRVNADQIANIAQHGLKQFPRARLRGDQDAMRSLHAPIKVISGVPTGIRTPVLTVKG